MKPTLLFLALLACALVLPASASSAPNELTPEEKAEGWALLFNGDSLAGWRGFKSEVPGAGWRVIDGAIVRTDKAGDLVTRGTFDDFELALEWKVTDGANSGIIYRVGLDEPHTYHTGPEYQVLDNGQARDRFEPKHRAGALYGLVAPTKDATKPVGEWNEARIVVDGWRIEHWLNGEKIVDLDLASEEGKALIAGSKFKEWPKFATLTRGHIALQDHGDRVSFRTIKLRPLKRP